MKKLATIEKITKFEKHPNADRLNLITVKGWECVTASNYEVGDLVVYIQIDTTVPKADWSEFLFDKGKPDQTRARIKTIKLRGRVSQGLCLPVDVLGLKPDEPILESDDVTEELGIEKYQKPVPVQLSGEVVGNFPTHICPKTDEERIQNFPELIDEFKALDCDVYVSVKMDGTSFSAIAYEEMNGLKNLSVCGRNWELKETDGNTYWKMAHKYKLDEKMQDLEVIQAEMIGPNIQKNPSGEAEVGLRVFNYGTGYGRKYFGLNEMRSFCEKNEIPMVPVIYEGKFKWNSMEELLEFADSVKYDNGKQAEGIVIRPVKEVHSELLGGRLSFKVISNEYAAKHGD